MGDNCSGVVRAPVSVLLSFSFTLILMTVFCCDRPNHPADGPALLLPSSLPRPPYNPRPSTPIPPAPSRKRSAPDDEVSEVEPSAKRAKTNGTSLPELGSPSKKRRLEEDGLVMLDSAADKIEDDDVIEID